MKINNYLIKLATFFYPNMSCQQCRCMGRLFAVDHFSSWKSWWYNESNLWIGLPYKKTMQEGSTQQRDIFFKLEVYRVQKMKHELYYRRSVEFCLKGLFKIYQTNIPNSSIVHVCHKHLKITSIITFRRSLLSGSKKMLIYKVGRAELFIQNKRRKFLKHETRFFVVPV